MIKDADYYKDRLTIKAREIRKTAVAGKSEDEFWAMYDDLQDIGFPSLLTRIGFNFPEARVLIANLVASFEDEDPNKLYDLTWVSIGSVQMPYGGELMTEKRTRAEMIERIQWISNEDFGEDIFEWSDWLEAFEARTPASDHR